MGAGRQLEFPKKTLVSLHLAIHKGLGSLSSGPLDKGGNLISCPTAGEMAQERQKHPRAPVFGLLAEMNPPLALI